MRTLRQIHDLRPAADTLQLDFDQRQKCRLRAVTDAGVEVGLFTERGTVLAGGERFADDDGLVIEVIARPEQVIEASTTNMHLLARCCYHLGNRHVPLQVGHGWLRLAPDHVLREMVERLGLSTALVEMPFHPESGAYSAHAAADGHAHHAHDHNHDHDHDHDHDHGHDLPGDSVR
ncbi:urease accessory protein UreE [Allohahella marinimesophila]|uniref:urease accessory protein UreE n=1 Tax=Allohahella marinimesophila TaxID=1054972 RepID=UPI0031D5C888